MAKLLRIDVSALPTYKERYAILKLFCKSFEVTTHWYALDPLHKTFDYFDVFWEHSTSPVLPQLPDTVKITER